MDIKNHTTKTLAVVVEGLGASRTWDKLLEGIGGPVEGKTAKELSHRQV